MRVCGEIGIWEGMGLSDGWVGILDMGFEKLFNKKKGTERLRKYLKKWILFVFMFEIC